MRYEVAVTQCNVFDVDDEEDKVQEYLKNGRSIEEFVTDNCIWEETFGTYYFEIDVQAT